MRPSFPIDDRTALIIGDGIIVLRSIVPIKTGICENIKRKNPGMQKKTVFLFGNLLFKAENAIREDSKHPWAEGAKGSGIGETLTVYFDGFQDVRLISLRLGYSSDDWHYKVLYVVDAVTDGISFVTIDTENAVVYDMQGRRVMNAQKGLYIVNGKKVVLK